MSVLASKHAEESENILQDISFFLQSWNPDLQFKEEVAGICLFFYWQALMQIILSAVFWKKQNMNAGLLLLQSAPMKPGVQSQVPDVGSQWPPFMHLQGFWQLEP